jgi:hypothetical protein
MKDEHRLSEEVGVRKWLAVGVVTTSLSLCAGSPAKEFRVYTCTTPDLQRGLGPTIVGPNLPSGWELSWSGLVFATLSDECPIADRFDFRVHGGPPMAAGQSIWVRWTAAPGTQLTGLAAIWAAVSDVGAA